MMNALRATLLVLVAVIGAALTSTAQIYPQRGFKTEPLGKDTLCFRYRFVAGDTLVYYSEAHDSIMMKGAPILLKNRRQSITITCDSVTADEHYNLTIVLTSSEERQREGSNDAVARRTTSPWIGRKAHIVIDSLGNRIGMSVDDEKRAALTPGGAFQPLILPVLNESCGRQNQSWIAQDTILLVENGVPEPVYGFMTLWRVIDALDTLDRHFRQIQYSQSGIGSATLASGDVNVRLEGVVAAYGKLTLDSALLVPYHLFATSENKLKIMTVGASEQEGRHLTAVNYHLVELRSPDPKRRFIADRR